MSEKRIRAATMVGGFLMMLIGLSVFFTLGYLIVSQLYKVTGRPPEILTAVFAGLIGAVFFLSFIWLLTKIRTLKHKNNSGRMIHNQMLDAISEIARGNFNVLLESEWHNPYGDIVDAINKMAKDLGGLETMRQEFISNVSHEIQSPLTSIGGFAALLKNDALSDAERRHYAEIIEAESSRLSSLSDNLLKLSALDSEKKTAEYPNLPTRQTA